MLWRRHGACSARPCFLKLTRTSRSLQNAFLRPDPAAVDRLVAALEAERIGVVAHFYMDPQVQGVLSSAGELQGVLHVEME